MAGRATRWSFGWIGTSSSRPPENPGHLALALRALEDVRRLALALGRPPRAAQGVILWEDEPEATEATIAEHRAAGLRMAPLSRDRLRRLEPHLAVLPELAALAPDDLAIDPVDLVRRLLSGARDLGASTLLGRDALGIETRGGRVTGVRCLAGREPGVIPADVVVLANGTAAQALAGTVGLDLGLRGEPAALMRLEAGPGLLRHLLCGPGLELRPGLPGGLVAAADASADGEAGLDELAARTLELTAALFPRRHPPSLRSVASAARPMTANGRPLRGFLLGVEGLYPLAAHPGAVLAPHLGRLAAEAVAGRLTPAS